MTLGPELHTCVCVCVCVAGSDRTCLSQRFFHGLMNPSAQARGDDDDFPELDELLRVGRNVMPLLVWSFRERVFICSSVCVCVCVRGSQLLSFTHACLVLAIHSVTACV